MANEKVSIGQLKTVVEVFQYSDVKSTTGEAQKNEQSLGRHRVMRVDAVGKEDVEGRLVGLSVCKYIMRYNEDYLKEGNKYMVRDVDGDWEVNSVRLLPGVQRNRFIELKCSKRGE